MSWAKTVVMFWGYRKIAFLTIFLIVKPKRGLGLTLENGGPSLSRTGISAIPSPL